MLAGTFGPVFASGTVDANGNAVVQFQAVGQQVVVKNMSTKVSTTTNEAVFTVYRNQVGDPYRHSGSFSGSSGDSNSDEIILSDGERIIGVWTGADVGATATMTISGTASVSGGGFRAMG